MFLGLGIARGGGGAHEPVADAPLRGRGRRGRRLRRGRLCAVLRPCGSPTGDSHVVYMLYITMAQQLACLDPEQGSRGLPRRGGAVARASMRACRLAAIA